MAKAKQTNKPTSNNCLVLKLLKVEGEGKISDLKVSKCINLVEKEVGEQITLVSYLHKINRQKCFVLNVVKQTSIIDRMENVPRTPKLTR